MVTKRPLVLQLVTSQGQGIFFYDEGRSRKLIKKLFCFLHFNRIEYGVFGHKPQQKFITYADIRNEIENDTKAVVRDELGVSSLPINLTVYSPHGKNKSMEYHQKEEI